MREIFTLIFNVSTLTCALHGFIGKIIEITREVMENLDSVSTKI